MADVTTFVRTEGLVVRTQKFAPPAMSKGQSRDIDYFIELISLALETDQDRKGVTKGKRLEVMRSWPKKNTESPGGVPEPFAIVAQKVIERQPGRTSERVNRRPKKPWHIRYLDHPDDNRMVVERRGQWMDNILEYKISTPHGDRTDELALYFQGFMLAWEFYFTDMGINLMHFEKRMEDKFEEVGGSELYTCRLRYFVRTEIVSQAIKPKIGGVSAQYDAGPGIKSTLVDAELEISDHTVVKPERDSEKRQ